MNTEPTQSGLTGSSNPHAKLSPSSSKCWSNCTAAPSFLEANAHRIAPDRGSRYAEEGTEAHEWAAKLLLNQITEAEVPESFQPYVSDYVNHCLATVPEGVSHLVEVSVKLFYPSDKPGTCDFAVVTDNLVIVRDLKYGQGELVDSALNPQLAVYGFSLIKTLEDVYDFTDETEVNIHAFQPRHREAEGAQPWILPLSEFRKFCENIEYRAIQAQTGLDRVRAKLPCGKRNISNTEILEAAPMVRFDLKGCNDGACRWRNARSICTHHLASSTEDLGHPEIAGEDLIALLPDLSKEDLKKPVEERIDLVAVEVTTDAPGADVMATRMVSDEYLVKIYERSKAIRRYLEDVESFLEDRLMAGEKIPGVSLVLGREGNRAWKSDAEAEVFLKGQGLRQEERFKFVLRSPTEMEKVLDIGKKPKRTQSRFKELISRSPARPVLALASDKKDAVSAPVDLLPDLSEDLDADDV